MQRDLLWYEYRSFEAMPALEQQELDGWVVRFAKGVSRRANSAVVLNVGTQPLEAKFAACSRMFAEREAPLVFRMLSIPETAPIDALLASQGYSQYMLSSIRTLSLANTRLGMPTWDDVILSTTWDEGWLQADCRLHEFSPASCEVRRQMIVASPYRPCFVRLQAQSETVSLGLGMLGEAGDYWIFGVITDPAHQGRGLARQVMLHLLRWGIENGANEACLQMQNDNEAARRLYDRFGFQERYQYWYRVKP